MYLACDDAAMRAAWHAAMEEGSVSDDLGAWNARCLICVAEDDVDFFDQARRAAEEIPNAEFLSIGGTDHLGVDTSAVDPVLPAVLRIVAGNELSEPLSAQPRHARCERGDSNPHALSGTGS